MQSSYKLHVGILGAGLAGLSTAVCLARYGHHVHVYEASPQLSELGAGIQVPPNAMRLLDAWDLSLEFEQYASKPDAENLRRYSNGKLIGQQRRNMKQSFGYDSLVIHRADFQSLLYRAALGCNVTFSFGKKFRAQELAGLLASENGGSGKLDLIIAADGISSATRTIIVGQAAAKPRLTGDTVSRVILPRSKLTSDPRLAHLIQHPTNNVWFGPRRHVVAYPVRNLELYNVVFAGPGEAPVGVYNEPYDLDLLRSEFADFEPTVQAILDKAESTHRWTLSEVPPLERWSSPDGRIVLLGDAIHAMLPYGAQGNAQCIEDAAVLGVCLSRVRSDSDLPKLLEQYEALRKPRCERIQTVSRENQAAFQYEDGPEQEARDARYAKMSQPAEAAEQTVPSAARPVADMKAPFASPEYNEWVYGYDALKDAEKHLARVWDPVHAR